VEDADGVAADEEGDAEHGLDALLAQDRVEDVGLVDVVEDDGAAFGGDASGEAASERDARAGLDLLLEPGRCARDELAPLRVEQEHRARVGPEQDADTQEQLPEQRVEVEVRERRVGDVLELPQSIGVGDLREPGLAVRERPHGHAGGTVRHDARVLTITGAWCLSARRPPTGGVAA
jgi:hypothetical protein